VQAVLSAEDLAGDAAWTVAERRRLDATVELVGEPGPLERLEQAPRAYVLRTPASTLAAHVRLLHPKPATTPRVQVVPEGDRWRLDVGWQDRPGLLAAITAALASAGIAVDEAVLATWPDGAVLDSFVVRIAAPVDVDALAAEMETAAEGPIATSGSPDAMFEVDQAASPWHTVCEVRMEDRPGALAAIAAAFAAARIEVRAASVGGQDGLVVDRFEVVDRSGAKLSTDDVDRLRAALRAGSALRRRRFGRGLTAKVVV
jgi:UTP:GlnB (protein PII) uridylyltransferase